MSVGDLAGGQRDDAASLTLRWDVGDPIVKQRLHDPNLFGDFCVTYTREGTAVALLEKERPLRLDRNRLALSPALGRTLDVQAASLILGNQTHVLRADDNRGDANSVFGFDWKVTVKVQ